MLSRSSSLSRSLSAIWLVPVLVLAYIGPARAQGTEEDPLMGERVLGGSSELLVIWSERGTTDEPDVHQDVLDFLSLPAGLGQISLESSMSTTGSLASVENFSGFSVAGATRDSATLDLNGDEVDDVVAIWEGPMGSINMIIPQIDSSTLGWTNSGAQELSAAGSLADAPGTPHAELRIVGGYFDADSEQEFVIAHRAPDDSILLSLYDTNGGLTPELRSTNNDIVLNVVGTGNARDSLRYDLFTGDLDGDGLDEIVLTFGQGIPDVSCPASAGRCWEIRVLAFDVDPDDQSLTPGTELVFFTKADNSDQDLRRIGVTTGDFDGDARDEAAIGFHRQHNGSTHRWYLQIVDFDSSLTPIDVDQDEYTTTNGSSGYAMSIEAADFDMDGCEEVVVLDRGLRGFEWQQLPGDPQCGDADFVPLIGADTTASFSSNPATLNRRALVIADLDADQDILAAETQWQKEVVVLEQREINPGIDPDSELEVVVYTWPGATSFSERDRFSFATEDPTGTRAVRLAAGDFGGNGIRVGTPKVFRKTEIAQPIVVLNAPPTHFDIFSSTSFDINNCYNANIPNCSFSSVYENSNSMEIEVQTEIHTDWGVTVRTEGGFSIPLIDVGVEVSMAATHGETFSKYASNGQFFETTQTISAIGDDQILATVSDYDIFEYPVLLDGQIEGYVAIVRPVLPRLQWFPSKSWTASTYFPVHEVGNIISYPNFGDQLPDSTLNPAIDDAINVPLTATTLDAFTNSQFTVTFGDFSSGQTTNSVFNGISGSVDFNIPISIIPDIGVDGDYSVEDISTHTSSVGMDVSLEVNLGGIDTAIGGGTRYTVRPYSYWGRNGAMVVDYAVQPEIANPGFETWWQEQYSTPDPAFLLPFRYDLEKGLAGNDSLRHVTRDIVLSPGNPAPGDEVTMTARIQNYSLVPTLSSVPVRFFIGDPGNSGTAPLCGSIPVEPCLIMSTGGATEFLTEIGGFPSTIPEQGNAQVEVVWQLPTGASYSNANPLRIFALIDPDDAITNEVHEDNNKGTIAIVPVPEPIASALALAALMALGTLAKAVRRA